MINFLLSILSAIPWKHHSFIAYGIVYLCYALVNSIGNELVIFPGIVFKWKIRVYYLSYLNSLGLFTCLELILS